MKPNIIFILSDDHGAWALHNTGTSELYTPNLDYLASCGTKLDNFFCVSPVCSPARASLLTGNIPSAHGVHDWIRGGNIDFEKFKTQLEDCPYHSNDEKTPISYLDGHITYTDLFAQNGYNCALSGKWHLGNSTLPQHGFSKWYTIGKGGCHYYHADVIENGTLTIEHGKYITELITDKALTFLDELKLEYKEKQKPFYLSVHYTAPHDPWGSEHHPKKWIDYYKSCSFESIPDVPDHENLTTGPVYGTPRRRENLIGYFSAISAMDEQIGRILNKLSEDNLLDSTIIIFTGDNGMSMGHHGIWGKGNGTFPFNMFDTAVKVPFIAYWKGHISSKTINTDLISAYDVFPTLLDLATIPQPNIKLPGKSFANTLLIHTKEKATRKSIVVYDEYGPVRMIRTKEWKYIHRYPYGKHELYNLIYDSKEEQNLLDSNYLNNCDRDKKIEIEQKVLEMRKQLENWFHIYVNPNIDGAKEGVTGGGQMCLAGSNASRIDVYGPL